MSGILEQYFKLIVVDKIDEAISKYFQELQVKVDAKFFEFRIELESLKKKVSDSGQEACEKIKGCESNIAKSINDIAKPSDDENVKIGSINKELQAIKKDMDGLLKTVVRGDDLKRFEKEILAKISQKTATTAAKKSTTEAKKKTTTTKKTVKKQTSKEK